MIAAAVRRGEGQFKNPTSILGLLPLQLSSSATNEYANTDLLRLKQPAKKTA
jgi:hypothetical protein